MELRAFTQAARSYCALVVCSPRSSNATVNGGDLRNQTHFYTEQKRQVSPQQPTQKCQSISGFVTESRNL